MGWIGRAWYCLLAVAAIGAFAGASASAAEYEVRGLPEVGKCTKVAKGTGEYIAGQCLHRAGGKGSYDWTQVTAQTPEKFAGSATEVTLASAGHPTVKCATAHFENEWTGPKTASVKIELQGCVNSLGAQCQTLPTNKSEILSTGPDEGKLGFIKNQGTKVVVGLDLKPTPPSTSILTYECTGSSETVSVEDSVIAKIAPIDTMTTSSKLLYSVTQAGAQRPEKFEGEPKDTLISTFVTPPLTKTSVPSTLAVKTYTGSNAVKLEIKAEEFSS